MEDTATILHSIVKYKGTQPTDLEDILAIEEPLEIKIKHPEEGPGETHTLAVTMRTPGEDEALALGFLFTEGIITSPQQVDYVEAPFWTPNSITVHLQKGATIKMPDQKRNFYTTSSCGVCGKASIEAIKTVSSFVINRHTAPVGMDVIYGLMDSLHHQQSVFSTTGGLHASALFTTDGTLAYLCEDVGRHNALDKAIGKALQGELLPLKDNILLLSGRASFELLQKANMAGIPIVVALGAPSSLAVQTAQSFGITLIGFLKTHSFNIYTFPERIK
ncbi:FdhD protein [Dyadobacter jejuensis]|uniref:Sulfur carrier protein FdhD n=1 Tax=Dyadobacter jejuensis TaxID=1082580 RepID=A0A316AL87_9BACT|nr:formate dehydrogenase accessory sulfurtransferase FdhD [Dyadobacter jejuensis]PWJ58311.1 FdhD protein [Dyadobacter jejuensis]